MRHLDPISPIVNENDLQAGMYDLCPCVVPFSAPKHFLCTTVQNVTMVMKMQNAKKVK